jgi:hypothetical protein
VKANSYLPATLRQLRRVPTPKGIGSREIVRRAIEFDAPPRIPYYFLFHPSAADIIIVGPTEAAGGFSGSDRGLSIGETYVDRWGIKHETTGRYWDHAIEHPLADLDRLKHYQVPDLMSSFERIRPWLRLADWGQKYVVGHNPVQMYETMRALMGFEALMMAPYDQPEGLLALLELLTQETLKVIRTYGETRRIHALTTPEDWGLQTSLQMKIDLFREYYKPFYKRIIDACHQYGMHFVWHNCGCIVDMFPDMIELGVDVVQLDQPRLMGHEQLIQELGGKICMWNTVDIQWSTREGVSVEDIRREVADMVRAYDVQGHRGGFIAKHYPQPWDIELSPERQRAIYEAFLVNGCGPSR